MSKAIIALDKSKSFRVYLTITTDMVEQVRNIHQTTPLATAGLGRVLTAAGLMGIMMKNGHDKLTVQFKGEGSARQILATAYGTGDVKGYIANPDVDLPLTKDGKLDVGGSLGLGDLTVIKDLGMKEPYNGFVPIVSGEIAEDITSYYATSEQIPTVCALGVLVNPDLSVKKAGGYILQLLPFTEDEIITKIENNLKMVKPVTALLDEGWDIEEIVKDVLQGFEVEVIYSQEVEYKCKCEREKVEQTLQGLGEKELQEMIAEMPTVEVKCHFCNTA